MLAELLTNDYFGRPPPKSLDRDHFSLNPVRDLSLEDGAATLTAFTAASVAESRRHMPEPPRRWLVTGGGRHNPTMMEALEKCSVEALEKVKKLSSLVDDNMQRMHQKSPLNFFTPRAKRNKE